MVAGGGRVVNTDKITNLCMTKYHTKTTRKELARTQKIMKNLINREKEDYDRHPLPKQPSHLLVIPRFEMQNGNPRR